MYLRTTHIFWVAKMFLSTIHVTFNITYILQILIKLKIYFKKWQCNFGEIQLIIISFHFSECRRTGSRSGFPRLHKRSDCQLHLRCLLRFWWPVETQERTGTSWATRPTPLYLRRMWQALRHVFKPFAPQADSSQSRLSAGQEMRDVRQGIREYAGSSHAHSHAQLEPQVRRLRQSFLATVALAGPHAITHWWEAVRMRPLWKSFCG